MCEYIICNMSSLKGLAVSEMFLTERGYELTFTKLYNHEELPDIQSFDWLLIMGGDLWG